MKTSCVIQRQKDWNTTLTLHYPLLTRGWAFQERILSRRCVHFTVKELVWECKAGRWCECGFIGDTSTLSPGSPLINNISAALEVCNGSNMVPLWREFVMSFSRRHLSKPVDRLTAISGIAMRLPGGRTKNGEGYVAGLWRDAMPFELLWRCDQTGGLLDTVKGRLKPSWSWGSVHCGVSWPTAAQRPKGEAEVASQEGQDRSDFEKSVEYLTSGTDFESGGAQGVEVLSVDVQPVSSRFGQMKWGEVVLRTRTVSVCIVKSHGQDGGQTDWVIQGPEKAVVPFYPDICFDDDGCEVGSKDGIIAGGYLFVEIASIRRDVKIWEAGLVVRPSLDTPDAYERVGMAGYSMCEPREGKMDWFGDGTPDIVRLA